MVLFRVEKKSRSERERNIEKHESRQAGGLSSEPLLSHRGTYSSRPVCQMQAKDQTTDRMPPEMHAGYLGWYGGCPPALVSSIARHPASTDTHWYAS